MTTGRINQVTTVERASAPLPFIKGAKLYPNGSGGRCRRTRALPGVV